jgi:hypothetical protein
MVQRIVCIVAFLMLTNEISGTTYEGHWSTPWHFATEWLMTPVPGIRLWWFDLIVVAALACGRAQRGARSGRARPLQTALYTTAATLFAWALLGAARGGSVLDMRLQLHVFVMLCVTVAMYANVLRTPAHFRMMGKTIVYAALFRAAMMFVFYLTVMRSLHEHIDTVTDHGDSITFVLAIVIVVAEAIHSRDRKATVRAVLVTAVMLWCIQTNNRRLAWVGLIGSMLVVYALLPSGPTRRRIHRRVAMALPALLVYVAVGWTSPTGVFKPIASLKSMNDVKDPSTESRRLENLGLIVTLQGGALTGTGFGQKYTEVSSVLAATVFPQYRYVPHNSVLGLAAFTGLGFIGIWMVFPVTAFLAARAYSFARAPPEKTIAMVALCQVFIHINQMWGDIGMCSFQGLTITSCAIAAASRMAVHTGAWPGKRARTRARPAANAAVAP